MATESVRLNTARPSGLASVKYRGDFEATERRTTPWIKPFPSVQQRILCSALSNSFAAEAAQSGGAPPEITNAGLGAILCALPNPSLNRSANGMSPGPVRGAVHSPQPGPGATPLSPG